MSMQPRRSRSEGRTSTSSSASHETSADFSKAAQVDRSIMVAVNMHPAEHNQLLLDFVVREKLPDVGPSPLDILDVEERARDLAAADAILLFGNLDTQNSYARHEVDSKKITLANYGSDLRAQPAAGQLGSASETHFLYCASEIGLRKGFDFVAAAFEQIDMETQGRTSSCGWCALV